MSFAHPKRLLVEGTEDRYAILSVMKSHIGWPDTKNEALWPVKIEVAEGIATVLDDNTIPALIATRGVRVTGVVVDADTNPAGRWQRFQQLCREQFLGLPDACPREGLVLENTELRRLGLWIMPDNVSGGMLENLLLKTIPADQALLRRHAEDSLQAAKDKGATFIPAHHDKALIHTWLAWQNPPGTPLGTALLKNILDAGSPSAAGFVQWFRRLFGC